MTTIPQYVTQMWTRQRIIATKLGCDITQADKPARVMNKALLVLIAVLIKTVVDKGLISDGDLLAVMNQARDDAYDDEPIEPPPP